MFLASALALQMWVLSELVVRRLLCIIFGVRHSPTAEYADRSVLAKAGGVLVRAALTPVRVAAAVATSPIALVLLVVLLSIVLAAAAQVGGPLLGAFAAVYNATIGPAAAQVLDLAELLGGVMRSVLPFYNAIVHFLWEFVVSVLGELIWEHASSVPELLSSFALACVGLGQSVVTYVANIIDCVQIGVQACSDSRACGAELVAVDARCVASNTHLSLDLMTPGVYVQKAFDIIGSVVAASCSRVAAPVRILVYPLLDYQLYKAVHLGVNVPLSSVRMAIQTVQRCAMLTQTGGYTAGQLAVGCAPDVAPTFAMAAAALRAAGAAGDAWVNYAVEETAIAAGAEPVCSRLASLDVAGMAASVETVLAEDGRVPRYRIVSVFDGNSNDNLVLTTGTDALSRRVGQADSYAFQLWPFEVDVRMGIASVETASGPGLLGCRCVDATDDFGDNMHLECASVPLERNGADSGGAYARATVHAVTLPGRGMTCGRTLVRVNSLRFSRRRAGRGVSFGETAGGLPGINDDGIHRLALTADAAIVVQPWCGQGFCSLLECFPFCMGLHASGVGAQNISVRAGREWDEFVSIRQSDCALTVDDGRCAAEEGRLEAIVETPDGIAERGRCGVRCVADDTASSFVPLAAYSTAVSNLTAFKTEAYPGVRLAAQPFVIAGDVFLVESGNEVVVTRLYDNGRGAFALAGEELTLLSHQRGVAITSCAVASDRACVAAAAAANTLPREAALRSYFYLPQDEQPTLPATVSPQAVHWAANPERSVYGEFFAFCNSGSAAFNFLVHSSYGRARVWTLKFGGLDAAPEVAYMPVPGFFDGSKLECDAVVNLEIVALEYVDPTNVLVTVLAARPRDYDPQRGLCWRAGEFDSTCSPVYRYYWLNPKRHDCLAADEADGETQIVLLVAVVICYLGVRMQQEGFLQLSEGVKRHDVVVDTFANNKCVHAFQSFWCVWRAKFSYAVVEFLCQCVGYVCIESFFFQSMLQNTFL